MVALHFMNNSFALLRYEDQQLHCELVFFKHSLELSDRLFAATCGSAKGSAGIASQGCTPARARMVLSEYCPAGSRPLILETIS